MSGSFVLLPQRASLNRRGSFRSAMLRLLRKGTEHGQVSQVSHSQKQFRPLGSLVVFPLLSRGGSSTFLTPKRRNGNLSMAQEMQSRPGFFATLLWRPSRSFSVSCTGSTGSCASLSASDGFGQDACEVSRQDYRTPTPPAYEDSRRYASVCCRLT